VVTAEMTPSHVVSPLNEHVETKMLFAVLNKLIYFQQQNVPNAKIMNLNVVKTFQRLVKTKESLADLVIIIPTTRTIKHVWDV
jgi:hypothetical protein